MRFGVVRISILAVLLSAFFTTTAQTTEESTKVSELIKFLEFNLNTLGDPEVGIDDKNTIVNQSYLKIFQDENVQVEDDLIQRQVSINKSIKPYLQDIDILFKNVTFKFDIISIEQMVSSGQKEYFKVTFNRTLTGTSVDGTEINNTMVRYAEVNLDAEQQVYKVASMYSSGIRDLKTFHAWWEGLNFEWKVVFQRAMGANVNMNEPHKVVSIKDVNISHNKYINNLEPLTYLTGLEVLNISNTGVRDISIVKEFANLRELYISDSEVQSLEALRGLEKLEILYFENTAITSLAPLKELNTLRKVVCMGTPIDLAEIMELKDTHPSCEVVYETADLMGWWKNLPLAWKESFKQQFNIAGTAPTGEDLARIKSSEKVDLEGQSKIFSLEPISDFKNVKILNLKKSGVRSLNLLKDYKNLERLDLSDTSVDSLGPIKNMELRLLVADYSNVNHRELAQYEAKYPSATVIYKTMDYTIWWIKLSEEWQNIFARSVGYTGPLNKLPLKNLYLILELQKLSIPEGSEIENIEPLTTLKNLRELKMSKIMKISDLRPLSGLAHLESLDCSFNPISDLTPLSGLNNLRKLNIENTRVADLEPLAMVKSLQVIKLSGTKISNIKPIRSLNNLVEISLQNTSVSNLSPLYTLLNLSKVTCFNTKVSVKDIDKFKDAKPSCEVVYY